MILDNVQKEAVMTLETAQKKIKDLQASTWWNYALMGVTLIIAGVNISNYVSQIRSIKREQPEL